MADWYFKADGQQVGPVAGPKIVQLIRMGEITPDTPLRADGGEAWRKAGTVAGLKKVFAQVQPAAPPRDAVPEQAAEPLPVPEFMSEDIDRGHEDEPPFDPYDDQPDEEVSLQDMGLDAPPPAAYVSAEADYEPDATAADPARATSKLQAGSAANAARPVEVESRFTALLLFARILQILGKIAMVLGVGAFVMLFVFDILQIGLLIFYGTSEGLLGVTAVLVGLPALVSGLLSGLILMANAQLLLVFHAVEHNTRQQNALLTRLLVRSEDG